MSTDPNNKPLMSGRNDDASDSSDSSDTTNAPASSAPEQAEHTGQTGQTGQAIPDPRETDHPAGDEHAEANAENEPPG
ncbi:hypothetical protein M6D93_03100 [Jatrophihabitans telluris]|uniref:Uncharacterized protein n=1 Tax=Jatrophihabitans telluris TaxID=2038343 RepID=A0ABY4QZV5_9ACTN|nr:hypothetical protein [Jatrophihabitans telluris]UQX88994.1 hypothetical protein M6D93_03100 [Jatrophihabitans telluris]